MTGIQTVRAYLNKVKEVDIMIDVKQKRLNELNAQKYSISAIQYDKERVQTFPTGDSLPRLIAKIVDLQEEINADIDRYIDLKAEVMHMIDQLENPDERQVLYAKYFEYKTLQAIADEIPCCKRTVQRLHSSGIYNLSLLVTL